MHCWKHGGDHHQWKFYVLMHRKTWLIVAVAQQVSATTVEGREPYHVSWVQRWTVWQVSNCLWMVNLSCPIASLESRLCVPVSWEGFWKQIEPVRITFILITVVCYWRVTTYSTCRTNKTWDCFSFHCTWVWWKIKWNGRNWKGVLQTR